MLTFLLMFAGNVSDVNPKSYLKFVHAEQCLRFTEKAHKSIRRHVQLLYSILRFVFGAAVNFVWVQRQCYNTPLEHNHSFNARHDLRSQRDDCKQQRRLSSTTNNCYKHQLDKLIFFWNSST